MSLIDLGRRKMLAVRDTSGLNPGNWTNTFTHDVIGVTVARFELYKITVQDVPGGFASPALFKGVDLFSTAVLAGNAEWDPAQPLPMAPEDDLYFTWDQPATGTPPTVWMWFRYDPAIQPLGSDY